MRKWIVAAAIVASTMSAYSYDINGTRWPSASTHIHTGMPGISPSGVSWSQALQSAMQEWNRNTLFTFDSIASYRDPCAGYRSSSSPNSDFPAGNGDGLNGVDFTSSVCGNNYGANVLAVTLVYTESNRLGSWDIEEADIVFNRNLVFDIYDGPIRGTTNATDFTRVALHELGHVIGLGHSNSPQAIMRPSIGSTFTLQADDIDGANRLYGGFTNCPVARLDFGSVSGQLQSGDCTVQTLMAGGTDTSLVDVYQLELQQTTQVSLSMTSPSLDSVLVLMNSKSQVIEIDDGGQGCNSSINRTLAAGTYAVLANTFVSPTKCLGKSGPYQLTASYQSSTLLTQGRKTSFLGGTTAAIFSGGVTINNGQSYRNAVTSTQKFDVVGRITIDPLHRNKPGFIVVAALLDDGNILVKHPLNGFVPLMSESASIPIATSKVLGSIETVDILSNAVAAQMGFSQITVGFLVGYGVNENPGELYFHEEPISLVVTP
ncbi:MAG: matrixin family metalloprotease [Gammaproteobacteria bacterium]|nr:matrixin family metalloprotease [Gammaproteobacteria bacterium]MDP2139756.1 matrixin family metalloprotease [Gammaproteobacteria bacterium]MDP2348958.1 matrixin family metalloprotease [Gammaproteobacteria bacterium]